MRTLAQTTIYKVLPYRESEKDLIKWYSWSTYMLTHSLSLRQNVHVVSCFKHLTIKLKKPRISKLRELKLHQEEIISVPHRILKIYKENRNKTKKTFHIINYSV